MSQNAPSPDHTASRTVLRLGTRASLLARMQSQLVADALERVHPGLVVELILIKTTGDAITDRPLHDIGGKGLFTRELERALIEGAVDFAVHSLKDVPVTMPLVDVSSLVIAATPAREDARDALAVRPAESGSLATTIHALPPGARVGTGSLRRRSQLLHHRPDLLVEAIRGNIDTRLRKLAEGQFDAVILAMAGLRRSGLFNSESMSPIEISEMLPSPGQGTLALQCRADDVQTRQILQTLHDPDTAVCIEAERAIVSLLQGDCHSPIGAYAQIRGETLCLQAAIGQRDGAGHVIFAQADGFRANAAAVADTLFRVLVKQGAESLLRP